MMLLWATRFLDLTKLERPDRQCRCDKQLFRARRCDLGPSKFEVRLWLASMQTQSLGQIENEKGFCRDTTYPGVREFLGTPRLSKAYVCQHRNGKITGAYARREWYCMDWKENSQRWSEFHVGSFPSILLPHTTLHCRAKRSANKCFLNCSEITIFFAETPASLPLIWPWSSKFWQPFYSTIVLRVQLAKEQQYAK